MAIISVMLSSPEGGTLWWLIGVDVFFWTCVILWIDFDLLAFSDQLKVIEAEINGLAGGEALLVWETRFGIGGIIAKRLRNFYRALSAAYFEK